MNEINYILIITAGFFAIASPGPATLAIAGTSMSQGRMAGVSLALGVLTGSMVWSVSTAFGIATILQANVWLFTIVKYCGALYLLYLAGKSLRSAFGNNSLALNGNYVASCKTNYFKGLLIHLTNPKAILFFGSLYSVGVPAGTNAIQLISVIALVAAISASIFFGYAFLFSNATARDVYLKSKVYFELAFGAVFAFAGVKLLVNEVNS